MRSVDRTHDPRVKTWVPSAIGHRHFPVQNLPLGMVDYAGRPTVATRIGEEVLPLTAALGQGWGAGLTAELRDALTQQTLAPLASLSPTSWTILRHSLFDALTDPAYRPRLGVVLAPHQAVPPCLPFVIGDYTDFYASIHHATNVGSMFRPEQPLLPNYKWVPIGYHGRSSSIVLDGTPVRRPVGQLRNPDGLSPVFEASRRLDYELELGFFIGGSQQLGETLTTEKAAERLFGAVLLNDWSARDIQSWEYQPLGPFLSKNFATSISPWIITRDALLPFRTTLPPRPAGDPAPLPHLQGPQSDLTWRVDLEVSIHTPEMRSERRPPVLVTRVNYAEAMYWSPVQMIVHHTSNGCNLRQGDLLGSGTVSGTTPLSRGCLLERSWQGQDPVSLGQGETRKFLVDGDDVIVEGICNAPGAIPIGFGQCTGRVLAR